MQFVHGKSVAPIFHRKFVATANSETQAALNGCNEFPRATNDDTATLRNDAAI
jgi:hypothetical protein